MYILGIDGGGTKTKATLFHIEKGILWSKESAATNPHSTSFFQSVMTVTEMVEQACHAHDLREDVDLYIGLGIAGIGRTAEKNKWLSLFKEQMLHLPMIKDIHIENDGKIALYSRTYGGDGIVSICGTGALTYGVFKEQTARVGGWGHLIGSDPGSGYHLGAQVLKAVFDAEDGVGPTTYMTELMVKGESVPSLQALIPVVYEKGSEKQRIATYARYVFRAEEAGDIVAKQIVQNAVHSIVENGFHVYQTLFRETEKAIPFVLAGGIFRNDVMVRKVRKSLQQVPQLQVTRVEHDPVIGSIITILHQHGYQIEKIKRLVGHSEVGES